MTDKDKQAGVREFDLKQADEILDEYPKPYSIIDEGNLFYAAREYKLAFEAEQIKRIEAEAELERTQSWYAVRWIRLRELFRDSPFENRVTAIMANGTSEPAEPPSYAIQMNLLKAKLQAAERERDRLAAENQRLREIVDNLPKVPTESYEKAMAKEILSLREEVMALRSVLSEWDQDKSCFTQMIRADDIAKARD